MPFTLYGTAAGLRRICRLSNRNDCNLFVRAVVALAAPAVVGRDIAIAPVVSFRVVSAVLVREILFVL